MILVADLAAIDAAVRRNHSDAGDIQWASEAAGCVGQACRRTGNSGYGVSAQICICGCAGRERRRGLRRGRWSVGGRPYEVVAECARLIILADLVGTAEYRARAIDDAGLTGFETRRGHASGVRLLRAIGQAESVLGDAIEAESRVHARPRHQISLVHVRAYRRRVERRAQAAVGAALRDRFFIHRVIEDRVDIDKVHAVRDVEALAVGVVAVGRQGARQVLGARARSRVIAQRKGSPAARDEVARRERDVGVGRAEAGRPVGTIAPERVRVGDEVDNPRRCRGRLRRSAAVAAREHEHCHYNDMK